MKKQTALDWYWEKIKSHFEHDGDLLETATFTLAIAKQKEREQIKNAWLDEAAIFDSEKEAEQYYNETFGGEQ